MGLLTVNGFDAVQALIGMPRVGTWTAGVVVDCPDPSQLAAGAAVVLSIDDGLLELHGTVLRGGEDVAAAVVRIVGGAGGLSRIAKPKFYGRGAFVRDVLGDILGDAGEALSSTSDATVTGGALLSWATLARSTGSVLGLLAAISGAAWRVLPDGSVWIGPEAWGAAAAADYVVVDSSPSEGKLVVGLDAPVLLPGTVLPTGERISYVETTLDGDTVRSTLWTE